MNFNHKWSTRTLTALSLTCMFSVAYTAPALAQVQTGQYSDSGTMYNQFQQYTIPAGTRLSVREIGIAPQDGAAFKGELLAPISVNGTVVIPQGSTLHGTVMNVNPSTNLRNIQLSTVTLPTGNAIAFNSAVTTPMPVTVAAVQEEAPAQPQVVSGQVTQTGGGVTTLYPQVSIGPQGASPAAKIIGGTLGGAALGAGVGTLTGLTMKATDSNAYNISMGSTTARGLAWGSAYGAGLGLLSGLIAAAATPSPAAVTTVSTQPQTRQRIAYQPAPGQTYDITLNNPVTVSLASNAPPPVVEQPTYTPPPQEIEPEPAPVTQPAPAQAAPVRGYW